MSQHKEKWQCYVHRTAMLVIILTQLPVNTQQFDSAPGKVSGRSPASSRRVCFWAQGCCWQLGRCEMVLTRALGHPQEHHAHLHMPGTAEAQATVQAKAGPAGRALLLHPAQTCSTAHT